MRSQGGVKEESRSQGGVTWNPTGCSAASIALVVDTMPVFTSMAKKPEPPSSTYVSRPNSPESASEAYPVGRQTSTAGPFSTSSHEKLPSPSRIGALSLTFLKT